MTSWRITSTTTTLCTETCAPFASGPSLQDTCWTSTSWSGTIPCSRSCRRGRTWWVVPSAQRHCTGAICLAVRAPSSRGCGQGQGTPSSSQPHAYPGEEEGSESRMEVTPFLFQYQCLVEGCAEKFRTSKDRKDHLVRRHLYPADFRFDKPKKSRGYVRQCDAHTVGCGHP